MNSMINANSITPKRWSQELEGLRGLASLWVVLGHICILVEFRLPILSDPSMGVDLFILLSGYLMAKNYVERQHIEPWISGVTFKKFWLRRFFRIAPLYYVLLIAAIFLGGFFGEARDTIASFYPDTQTNTSRYSDSSFANIITHLTFIFGFIPHFSFNTVLPDWSIGLEMQYYVIFPFLMMISLRIGFIRTCISAVILCLLTKTLIPQYFAAFPMPSMILIKLNIFIAGMLISYGVKKERAIYILLALIATIATLYLQHGIYKLKYAAQVGMIIMMTVILWNHKANSLTTKLLRAPKWMLTNKFSVFLGDVSYSVYLLHLMIVLPVIAFLLGDLDLESYRPIFRFLMAISIILPVTYLISYVLFKFIEKPGIKLGKSIVSKLS